MEFIKVNKQHEKFIAVIELNRPKELNALNRELMLEIRDTLRELDEDENACVIILTGGQRFCCRCRHKTDGECHSN